MAVNITQPPKLSHGSQHRVTPKVGGRVPHMNVSFATHCSNNIRQAIIFGKGHILQADIFLNFITGFEVRDGGMEYRLVRIW
jgi:hypothetical protein